MRDSSNLQQRCQHHSVLPSSLHVQPEDNCNSFLPTHACRHDAHSILPNKLFHHLRNNQNRFSTEVTCGISIRREGVRETWLRVVIKSE